MSEVMVSVLTTAYNREKYIAAAIESVLNQNYPHFEYIIVDDNSNDKSYEIACGYAKKDSRIRVFRNEQNLGDYPNRNKAASYATGKYIKYLDSDDILYPHCLQVMISYAEKYPEADVQMAIPINVLEPYPILLSPGDSYRKHYFEKIPILSRSPLSAMIRRDAFNNVGCFSGKQYVGDWELWHKLGLKSSFLLIPGCLGWAREHENQQMKTNREVKSLQQRYYQITKTILSAKNIPLSPNEVEKIINRLDIITFRSYMKSLLQARVKEANEILKESQMSFFKLFKIFLINSL